MNFVPDTVQMLLFIKSQYSGIINVISHLINSAKHLEHYTLQEHQTNLTFARISQVFNWGFTMEVYEIIFGSKNKLESRERLNAKLICRQCR